LVIQAGRFADAVRSTITDPEVLAVVNRNGQIGGIDQFADSTDVLSRPAICNRLKAALTPDQ